MAEVTVIIPNYNGEKYLETCLNSLRKQTISNFDIILVDNGSSDGSVALIRQNYTEVKLIRLKENFGFSRAVNEGIKDAATPFVILLNNDTEVFDTFVEEMLKAIKRSENLFSCSARMISYSQRDKIDDAGNYYCALGWAFAKGKGKAADKFEKSYKIFSSCAGAAIYRKKIFDIIGYFDEKHFVYLEDVDVGYRSRIYGYENKYAPHAKVYHVGSGTSGSQYNSFKVKYSSRNNVYLIYKNMPALQILINLPLLILGFAVKIVFFAKKGFTKDYICGTASGIALCLKEKKVKFQLHHLKYYFKIQIELWKNVIKRLFC